MSLINVTNLTFSYDGSYENVFEDISFQINTDWKLGFIGRNGRGKTTFLKLLMGDYEYEGLISANVKFEYFPYHVGDETLITLDIVESIYPFYTLWILEKELKYLETSYDILYRPFNTLSRGEQTKVLLAVLFMKENSFLLIDEPTNHLDERGRQLISDYLKGKKSFILVSHDRNFMDNCVDHILSINSMNIEIQKGNFSSWWDNKEKQDNFEMAQNNKLRKDIKRLEIAAKQSGIWADKVEGTKIGKSNKGEERSYVGEKSRRMQSRRKNLEKRQDIALEGKEGLLKNIEIMEDLKLCQSVYNGSKLLELNKVSLYYDEKEVCSDISFLVEKGDRILLRGKNGSGKSSILNLIQGKDVKFIGLFNKSGRLKISFVSQDSSFLEGSLKDFAEKEGIDESLFKAILRKLDFERSQFDKDMKYFSQGQKKKVLIAKSLCEEAHLYIWDEPLNYIDVFSRMQIESLILKHNPAMIFVEHDKKFSSTIATKIISL